MSKEQIEEFSVLGQQMVRQLGINTDQYSPELFMCRGNKSVDFAPEHRARFLAEGADLLQEIAEANLTRNVFEHKALMKILHQRWDWIRESCGISFKRYEHDQFVTENPTPVVSVVLPSYNSVQDICRSIDSILDQTFTGWELLVVNDLGSDDGTPDLVRMYSLFDNRIQIIQVKEERLGLAESLNTGIRAARGKYVARLDADDTSAPTRFEKQVAYLDAHPEVGVCGTWQRHYGPERDWVHEAPANPAACKARLLFWCDLCHSTLMIRRNVFVDNDLYYDQNAYAEDYELWTRAMEYTEFANLPEVLGEYKEDGTSITSQKFLMLCEESGRIVANTLRRIWGIEIPDEDVALFKGWKNDYATVPDKADRLRRLEELLRMIWYHNQEHPFFDNQELLQAIAAKWYWAKKSAAWTGIRYNVSTIDDVFNDRKSAPNLLVRYSAFRKMNPSRKVRIKKIIKKCTCSPFIFALRQLKQRIFREN